MEKLGRFFASGFENCGIQHRPQFELRFFLANLHMILYNARMAIIVAVVVALFFFLAGCVKMGIFISRCPDTDIPALVDQLLLQAWPLGVAALLFVLIDICLRRRSTSLVADEVSNIPEHPLSAPLKNSHPVTDNIQSASSQSYFYIDGQQLPQSSPEPKTHAKQQSYSQGPVPFSTPPPFEESAPTPPSAHPTVPPPDSYGKQDASLSFFKL